MAPADTSVVRHDRKLAAPAAERKVPSRSKGRLLLVTPRPPCRDGHGDQRRAHEILTALAPEWTVEVLSWMPGCDRHGLGRWGDRPGALARAALLATRRPLQVAYVQGRAPRRVAARLAMGDFDRVVFVTDRAVPAQVPAGSVVDLIDDLGATALRRADASAGLRAAFWHWEARRLRRLDGRIAESAAVTVAHSPADAAGLPRRVEVVPLAVGTRPMVDDGDRVVFVGNLFYAPNHEAAMWICAELAPSLRQAGVDPGRLLIAGRRPRPALVRLARHSGVELRADVDDLAAVLAEAVIALSPMALGSGAQYKVLDACGAGRPCVLSPRANAGLGLVEGKSALVRDREGAPFAEAAATLLGDPALRHRLAAGARDALGAYYPAAVAAAWRSVVDRAGRAPGQAPLSPVARR